MHDHGVSQAAVDMGSLQTVEHMLYEYSLSICREAAQDEVAGRLGSSHTLYTRALVLFQYIVDNATGEV